MADDDGFIGEVDEGGEGFVPVKNRHDGLNFSFSQTRRGTTTINYDTSSSHQAGQPSRATPYVYASGRSSSVSLLLGSHLPGDRDLEGVNAWVSAPLTPAAARLLAAQLLASAEAADNDDHFSPEYMEAPTRFRSMVGIEEGDG